jgi:hypothetical protein
VVHDLAAGFALDALDAREAEDFVRHLRICPDCEDQLERLRPVAVALAFAGDLPHPRPDLRRRVLDVPGGVVVPLRRRWMRPLAAAGAVAAAAAIAVGLHVRGGPVGAAGMQAYPARGAGGGSLLVGRSGEAVLLVHGLPARTPGSAYELWVVRGGVPEPAGFVRGAIGVLTRRLSPGASVAVSLEPAGGSRRPTGPLLVRVETA